MPGSAPTYDAGVLKPVRSANALRHRARQLLLIRRVQLLARLRGAHVQFDVAPDLLVGKRLRIAVEPRTRTVVTIGRECRFEDDVYLVLGGGELRLGERCEIRKGVVVRLSGGLLHMVGGNKVSYYTVLHCSAGITLDTYAGVTEHVSIIDTTHHHDGPEEYFQHNSSSAPIYVGRNTWVCSKSSVLMGVRVGHNSVIASGAVVNRDVPSGVVVGGIPARVLGPRVVAGPALKFFDEGEPVEVPAARVPSAGGVDRA